MSTPTNIYPAEDLPLVSPAASDSMIGIDETNQVLRRFPLKSLPVTDVQQDALDAMQSQVDELNAGRMGFATWSAANSATITDGTIVEIIGDTGTHTDPVSGSTVSNSGTFLKVSLGLQWLRDDTLSLKADKTEAGGLMVVGRPQGTDPVEGTNPTGSNCAILNAPVINSGQLFKVRCYCRTPGVNQSVMSRMSIYALSKASDSATFTVKRKISIPLTTGLNVILLDDLPELLFDEGDYIGYQSYYVGLTLGAAADSGGYWAGPDGTTIVDGDGVVNTANRLEVSFEIGGLPYDGYINSKLINSVGDSQYTIGKKLDLQEGSANPDRTFLMYQPAPKSGVLKTFRAYSLTDGYVDLLVFNYDGSKYNLARGPVRVNVVAGNNEITLYESLAIDAGDYVGFYAKPGTLTNWASGTYGAVDPEVGRCNYLHNGGAGGGYMTSFAATNGTPSVALEVGFVFDIQGDNLGLKRRVEMLEAAQSSPGWNDAPSGQIIVFAIGQSDAAGRALVKSTITFRSGQAYKYVRSSQSLELLADPTGNDAVAVTGRGSWGPAFANEIRRLSNGHIGTIIVNSAEGGTTLSPGWQEGGQYWNQASTDLDNALAAAAAAKLPIVGACVYMDQGQSDGDSGTSKEDYKTFFANLKALVDAKIGPKVPFLMTRIGTKNTGDTPEYATIREAQNEIATTVDGVYLVHTGAKYFLERGLMMDEFHYTIDGYDEIGASAGNAAFGLALGIRPLGFND